MYDKLPVKIKKRINKYPKIPAKVPHKQKIEVVAKVITPEIQKVIVTNPPEKNNILFPETQKVEVTNQIKPVEVQKVEVTNPTPQNNILFPDVQKVEVTNPTPIQKIQIPIGKGNIAGKADPEEYVPVRLTDGKKFYRALEDAWVAASKATKPALWASYVNSALSSTYSIVKSGAGEFGGYYIYNPNNSVTYIQVFDKLNPSVGTDNAKLIFGIPASGGANIELQRGIGFANGITIAATTTPTGNTGPNTALVITIYYL